MTKAKLRRRDGGARAQVNMFQEIAVDLFSGGGGTSTGYGVATGRVMDIAINHSRDAVLMHKTNHPHTEHYQTDVFEVDPRMATRGRPVGLLWASPDCRHFSKAKGAPLVDRKIRGLAWVILRWAMDVRPRVIMAENVEEIQTWGPLIPVYKQDGTLKGYVPDPERKGETFQAFIGMLGGGVPEDCPALDEACEFLKIDRRGPEALRLMDGCCLEDGTEVNLTFDQTNIIAGYGIVTALNFMSMGWTCRNNYTACYPGNTDVKDMFIPVSRMFDFVGNTLIRTFWSKLDKPMNRRLIDTILDTCNIWLNGLVSQEYLLGARAVYLEEENPLTDLMAGIIRIHIYLTPPSPMQQCDFTLEYDTSYVTAALAA